MKVLQVYTYYPPENVASTHLKKDLAEAYVNAGFELCVVAPIPTRGVDESVYRQYRDLSFESIYDGKINIYRFRMFREKKDFISRIIRYLLVNIKQYHIAVKMRDVDVISTGSTPPTQGLVCAKLKKKLKVPFVYNLQDIFPDSLFSVGKARKDSIIWKIGRNIEDRIYQSADKIIVISEEHKNNIMEKGVPENKIVVVPNWVNTENVYSVPREKNPLFERFGLDRKYFYITYCGNLGMSQNFSHLFTVAEQMQRLNPNIHFVLIGEGVEKERIEKEITTKQLENLHIFPFQPYEDIAYVFSLGDAGLIISKEGVAKNSVPSKTWSILAAEKPVLASFDADGDLSRLIRSIPCGLVSQPNDVERFVSNIETLFKDDLLRKEMGANGRRYLDEYLNKDKCVSMYVQTLKDAASKT